MMSVPPPPVMVSLPDPPISVSLPPPPSSSKSCETAEPSTVSLPPPALTVTAPAPSAPRNVNTSSRSPRFTKKLSIIELPTSIVSVSLTVFVVLRTKSAFKSASSCRVISSPLPTRICSESAEGLLTSTTFASPASAVSCNSPNSELNPTAVNMLLASNDSNPKAFLLRFSVLFFRRGFFLKPSLCAIL